MNIFLCLGRKFVIRRRTIAGKIPYYVTKDFGAKLQKHYNGLVGDLEKDVKNAYKTKLERACKRERDYSMYFDSCLHLNERSFDHDMNMAFIDLFTEQSVLDEALNSPSHQYWYERVERAKALQTPSCKKLQFLGDILYQRNIWEHHLTIFMKFLRYIF